MNEPPLNVDFWASRYRVYERDNEEYEAALGESSLVDKAERLWEWKGLNRSVEFEDIRPAIDDLDIDRYVDLEPDAAVREVLDQLRENGPIDGDGLVTPAFLLHLGASSPGDSSVTFPIYDRRVWNAYVYLWGLRGADERLAWAASKSTDEYGRFSQRFQESRAGVAPRRYEQALFMFGGFIMSLASGDQPTSIQTVDEVLGEQEDALRRTQETAGYGVVNLETVRGEQR
ncbi:hypothetical protein [Salinarchaeum laminariae]|uniref:hypothetical protein n=1 Tax=Salinarchaeum laminariae TaxID=869888 RepID=UPI0020BEED80|nr:hypothetical protein [Salinarchaeum laminariae]